MIDSKYIRGKYISSILRSEMSNAGLTNRELANTTGIAEQTISAYINARKVPSDTEYRKISDAIGITYNSFQMLIKGADDEVYFHKYGIYPGQETNSDIDDIPDNDLLEIVYKRKGMNVSEHDKEVIERFLRGYEN